MGLLWTVNETLLHSDFFGFKAHRDGHRLNIWAGKLQFGLVMEVLQKLYVISFVTPCYLPIASGFLSGSPGRDLIC